MNISIILFDALYFFKMDENTKLFETFATSLCAFWVIGFLYFICELGERMTHHFSDFSEELKRYDWHKRPIKMRRLYLLFLMDIEQPKHIKCGSISCTRETFRRVFERELFFDKTIFLLNL